MELYYSILILIQINIIFMVLYLKYYILPKIDKMSRDKVDDYIKFADVHLGIEVREAVSKELLRLGYYIDKMKR